MFQAMFYMVLGYVFQCNFEGIFDRHNTVKARFSASVLYALIVFVPLFAKIEMPMMLNIGYDYFSSIFGIFTLIMISKTVKSNKYVNYVGQNTLIYFALHGKVYSLIQTVLRHVATEFYEMVINSTLASSLFCLVLSLLMSVILILPTYIINRWIPCIVGRNR